MGRPFASGSKAIERQLGNRTQAHETQREKAMAWLERHLGPLRRILSSRLVRDFVFEPFKGLFDLEGDPTDVEVRRTITSVALMNAAMAAVPGSMGYGLFVAIALETYMAFRIARLLQFDVSSPRELANTLGAAAVTALGAIAVVLLITLLISKELAGASDNPCAALRQGREHRGGPVDVRVRGDRSVDGCGGVGVGASQRI